MKKSLSKGDSVIPFIANDYRGKEISLKDYQGKKVLLSFFRFASCPFCNLHIRRLIVDYPQIEQSGVEVIGVFASPASEIAEYAGQQNPPFPIISDPDRKLFAQYAIQHSYNGLFQSITQVKKMWDVMSSGFFNVKTLPKTPLLPADFQINESQNIDRAHYGKDYGDHIPIEQTLDWARK